MNEAIMAGSQVTVLAVLIESLVETVKNRLNLMAIVPEPYRPLTTGLLSIIFGIGIAVLAGVDLMTMLGLPLTMPVVGEVLTGLLVSRGANVFHDLWKRVAPGK